ncbi:MAG: hypothetical protein ABJN34_08670 [Litoreibacter sp.]|uniref:hypothetical protein n=1 Tax=Litoreibacter sp. TaxID=1969459 RepID=UPI0032995A58
MIGTERIISNLGLRKRPLDRNANPRHDAREVIYFIRSEYPNFSKENSMSGNMKLVAEVKRQTAAHHNLPFEEIKVRYPTLDPAGLQRTGLSPRGAKELSSGAALSNPKDRKIAALIIAVALK